MAAKASLVRLSALFFWGAGCSTSAAAHEMGDRMLPRCERARFIDRWLRPWRACWCYNINARVGF
ncbi:hypothetical protein HBH51_163590 [Parastagonospora nodorum]|nr:hypothetical protein HBH51_163590 [Parastagonospora nodorum]KAH4093537.1 hypothetical protein HBH46_175850 [Parastagonospora nodorum]